MVEQEIVTGTLSDLIEVVEREPWIHIVEHRFGIPEKAFDPYVLIRPNSKTVHLIPRNHRPPARPAIELAGLPFLRTYLRYPKLTTAAAMHFGHLATRNVVQVDADQANAFLARDDFSPAMHQFQESTGRGYVLIRYETLTLGVGFCTGPDRWIVKSMFPKAWARGEDVVS